MTINFPSSLDNFTNPTSSSPINSPSHADQHANANDAIEALEAKVGVDGSTVVTSHDYKIAQLQSLVTSAVAGAKSIYQDVRNQSGSAFTKATPVYVSGSTGASGQLLVSAASNATEATSSKTMGITTSAISNNSNGQVISEGILEGIDTTGAADGDPVWLGVNGAKIYGLANKPSAPAHLVFLGIVIRGGQANTGSMYVKIQNGFELQEIHNVEISSLVNGNILAYDSTTQTWKNTNTLQSTSSTIPLIVKRVASQTVNLQEWNREDGVNLSRITEGGVIATIVSMYSPYYQGANGGGGTIAVPYNQPIKITPQSSSITSLVVQGAASQTADLQQWQNSSGSILAAIKPSGQLKIQNIIDLSDGGPTIQFGSAAINIWTFSASAIPLIINAFTGQSNDLTQWKDSSGNKQVWINSAGVFNALSVVGTYNSYFYAGSSGAVPIRAIGAVNQTGNLQEWKNSSGTVLASVSSAGGFGVPAIGNPGSVGPYQSFNSTDITITSRAAANIGLIIKGAESQTADLMQWQTSTGSINGKVDNNGTFWIGTANLINYGYSTFAGNNAGNVPIIIIGAPSQTADLQQWKNSAGTVLSKIASNGRMVISSDTEVSSGMLTISQAATSAIVLSTTSTANDYGLALNATGSGNNTSIGISFSAFASNGYNGVATPGGAIWFTRSGSYSLGYLSFLTRSGVGANDPLTERMRIGDTGTVSISGFTASSQGLIIKAAASQTADLQQWQDTSGTVLGSVVQTDSNNMVLRLPQIQGKSGGYPWISFGSSITNTANQATDKPLVVKGASSQSANLTEWQNSAGTVLSNINSSGLNEWRDSTGAYRFGLKYSADRNIIDINSTNSGLVFGWSPNYIGGYGTDAGSGNTWWFSPFVGTRVGVIIRGKDPQTANLQEWQTNTGQVNASISSSGYFTNYMGIIADNINSGSTSLTVKTTYANVKPMIVQGATSQTANLQEWQDSAGTILAAVSSIGTIRSNIFANTTGGLTYLATNFDTSGIGIVTSSAAQKGLIVRGSASQTANLQEWQNSSGTALGWFNAYGSMQITNSFNGARAELGNTGVAQASTLVLKIQGVSGQTANLTEWQTNTGAVVAYVDPNGSAFLNSNLQVNGVAAVGTGPQAYSQFIIQTNSATRNGLIIKGASGQTANLQEWQNSNGNVVSSIRSNGGISLNYANAIRLYNTANTDYASLWMDNGSGGTNLYTKLNYPLLIGNMSVDTGAWLTVASSSASAIPLIIQHASSPTSSYFEIRNSAGNPIWGINSAGESLTRTTTKYGANIQNDSSNNNNALYVQGDGGGSGIPLYVKITSGTKDIVKFDNGGVVKLSITSDGSLKGGNSNTISVNTASTVDTVALSSFTSMEYTLSIKQGSKIRSSKVLVHTDGTSVDSTEYGIMEMGGGITGILVTASVSGTDAILQVTITDAATTNATVKLIKTML